MEILKIPFEDIPQFSKRDVAYYNEDERLKPFFKYPVNVDSFKKVIEDKSNESLPREVLTEVLREQYSKLSNQKEVCENIEKLLSQKTFTLITAHQPSLFTGPLYYIFKIISIIKLISI